jgi:hypothetical protein
MPSTVIYKQGFPNSALPVETSATVGSDGAITGSATFVVASTAPYEVGGVISALLFSSLRGIGVQGLFVDAVSLEKRGGLVLAKVSVSSVVADWESVGFEDETPILVSVFNNRGSINVTNSLTNAAGVGIARRVITNETRTRQNNIARVQKSFELILQ